MIAMGQNNLATATIMDCAAKSRSIARKTAFDRVQLSLLVIASLCVTTSTVTRAQDESVQLILSHWVPPSHPLQAAIEDWANDIKKNSNETIDTVIFPAELLGKAFAHYDMARNGDVSVALVSPGYHTDSFPIIAAGDLPFVYDDAKIGTAAIDEWYRKYATRELRGVHYCFAFVQEPGTLHSRKKVVVPDDIRGLKIRQPNATMGELIKRLGGESLKRSAPDSRDLLERGEADGIFFPWGSTLLFGIDKVVHYNIDAKISGNVFLWVMNQSKYDNLSPIQKGVIDDHCTSEWAVRFASAWADFERSGRATVRAKKGDGFIELKPKELDQWEKLAKPLQVFWAEGVRKTTGANTEIIWRDLQDSLSKHHARYSQAVD
jgi:TRAP-type C4-dicarboxylate transport system substrate-binding protein